MTPIRCFVGEQIGKVYPIQPFIIFHTTKVKIDFARLLNDDEMEKDFPRLDFQEKQVNNYFNSSEFWMNSF